MKAVQGEVVSEIHRQLQAGNKELDGVACKCGQMGTLRHAIITGEESGKPIKTVFVHCCSCTAEYVMPS